MPPRRLGKVWYFLLLIDLRIHCYQSTNSNQVVEGLGATVAPKSLLPQSRLLERDLQVFIVCINILRETFAKSGKLFLSVIPDLFVSYRGFFGQFSPHEPGISLNTGYFRLRGYNIAMFV